MNLYKGNSCYSNCILVVVLNLLLLLSSASATTIFVDGNAVGMNNGSSWTDAYVELHDAIVGSVAGDEIWVAAGTYVPSTVRSSEFPHTDDRLKTFEMKSLVGIYGGFNATETSKGQRNWLVNISTLSGQLDPVTNAYNVVLANSLAPGSVLDGFTVLNGEANGSGTETMSGGGIHINDSTLTIENCIFKDNYSATVGGGLKSTDSVITLINCQFNNNIANSGDGGGVECIRGSATVECCEFTNNEAGSVGGGMACGGTDIFLFDLAMHHCMFRFNETTGASTDGGGLFMLHTNAAIDQCDFSFNTAANDGGAIAMDFVNSTIERTRFVNNIAARGRGGAIMRIPQFPNEDTTMCIRNSVFSCNRAETDSGSMSGLGEGGALWVHGTEHYTTLINCTIRDNHAENIGGGIYGFLQQPKVTISNSIFWGNTDESSASDLEGEQYWSTATASGRPLINYSCIEGLMDLPRRPAVGNISSNPLFAISFACEDDGRLSIGSPCKDAGTNTPSIPVETPCFDAPAIGIRDHDGNNRLYDVAVDMGAFEVTDCNANGIGDFEDVLSGLLADVNANFAADLHECPADIAPAGGDGTVNVTDLLFLLGKWGLCPCNCPADIDRNGVVDVVDQLILTAAWGACPCP